MVRRRGSSWLPLALAVTGGMLLAGLWFSFGNGGGAPSDGSATRESQNSSRTIWGVSKISEADTRQGGGEAAESYYDDESPPLITALAAVVLDEPCGAVLHRQNAGLRMPPASLTKIATALVAVEQAELIEMVTVNVSAAELTATEDATVMGIEPGQEYSILDLLYGMLLPSGNDAAIAIAEHVGGSETAFVRLMNAKAEQLGLTDTQFTNPHGLDDPGLYTSAYDIAMMGRALLGVPELAQIVSTRSYQPDWSRGPVENHNLLLSLYPGAIGVKTGYTDLAAQTLVAAAERNGRRLIVSVLGSQDIYVDVIALLDWGFESAQPVCGAPPPAASRLHAGETAVE